MTKKFKIINHKNETLYIRAKELLINDNKISFVIENDTVSYQLNINAEHVIRISVVD